MAITPTISLGRVSRSTSNLRSTVSQGGKETNRIKNTLTSNLSRKRNLWNSTKIFRTRREEFEKRQVQKDLITTPSILSRRGGARLLSQQDKSTSITDRLLGFVKYLTAGWLLGNLPTWINYGEQFVGRLGTAGSILSNYGDETLAVMKSIGSIFSSALKNLSAFDFTDNSGLMRTSIGELTSALDDLGTGLSDALDVLFAPFKELPAEPKEEPTPPLTPPGTPSPTGGNSDFWTLVAIVSREDSDPQGQADVAQSIYNRARAGVFPGKTSIRDIILAEGQYQPTRERPSSRKNSSKKTNPEWFQITDAKSAAKAADFDEATIKGVARNITNPTLQKEAAKFVAGRTDFKGASIGKYPSIQRKSGDNWFGWEYGYRGTTVSPVPNFGVTQTPPPQSPTPTSLRNFAPVSGTSGLSMGNRPVSLPYSPVKPGSGIVITSVMGRRWGRQHTGYDLAGNSGTPLYAYFPGKVTHIGLVGSYNDGGYGNWVVWKDDVYGAYHFFGHMLRRPEVRVGQTIQQGTLLGYIGSTGRSEGPHLHWEISSNAPDSMGNFTSGRQDVGVWLKSHPLKAAQSTTTQISSTAVPTTPLVPPAPQLPEDQETDSEMQTNANQTGVRGAMVQERRGQKIIIVDDRGAQIPQKVMTYSGDTLSIQIDESALLNNFMRNKLLLDLNYV